MDALWCVPTGRGEEAWKGPEGPRAPLGVGGWASAWVSRSWLFAFVFLAPAPPAEILPPTACGASRGAPVRPRKEGVFRTLRSGCGCQAGSVSVSLPGWVPRATVAGAGQRGGLVCAALAGPPGARAPGDRENWLGEEMEASWVR